MMPKLVNAHELWAQIYILSYKHRWKDRTNIAFSKCLDAIQFFPAVDAMEVVRCKDCQYRGSTAECLERDDDWFCADGKRREDGR